MVLLPIRPMKGKSCCCRWRHRQGHHVRSSAWLEAHDEHPQACWQRGQPCTGSECSQTTPSGGWGGKMPSRLSIVSAKAAAPKPAPGRGPHGRRQNRATGVRRPQAGGQAGGIGRAQRLKLQVHHAAAALAQGGAQGVAHLRLASSPPGGGARRPWPGAPGGHRQWCRSRGRPAPAIRPQVPRGRAFGRLHSPATQFCAVVQPATSNPSVTSALSPVAGCARRYIQPVQLSDSPPACHPFHPARATRAHGNVPVGCAGCWPAQPALAACKSPPPQAPRRKTAKCQPGHRGWPAATPARHLPQPPATIYRKGRRQPFVTSHNQQRVHKDKLPPMLYAIGVLSGH